MCLYGEIPIAQLSGHLCNRENIAKQYVFAIKLVRQGIQHQGVSIVAMIVIIVIVIVPVMAVIVIVFVVNF